MEILSRFLKLPERQSFFLFGPRGTGKTQFLRQNFKQCLYLNLLLPQEFARYSARPELLISWVEGNLPISGQRLTIIVDEVQKVPALLSVVHELLERPFGKNLQFILTGSSSRKLKSMGADLLAGRALSLQFHPFLAKELGSHWNLDQALQMGTLPVVLASEDPSASLSAYIGTYLKEEVLQERLVRNLESFARFLEVLSFSQGSPLNVSSMSREASVGQKTAEGYIEIIQDLLIGSKLTVFQKKAKRELSSHPKFYYFDCGVFRSLRPVGPLDEPHQIEGQVLETLVYQHLRAWLSYQNDSSNGIYYWRTRSDVEVDFVLYGKNLFSAIEVKNSSRIRVEDLKGLRTFGEDYPQAKLIFLYRGSKRELHYGNIACLPVDGFLKGLDPKVPTMSLD